MLIYVFLILIFLIFSIGHVRGISKNILFNCMFFILWFMATFRDCSIGNDTYNYYSMFQDFTRGAIASDYLTRFEIGYVMLNYVVSIITDSFVMFLAIINTFIYIAYYLFIKKYSCNYILSASIFLLLGFWGQTVNVLRVEIATAILLYAFLLQDRYKKTSVVIALSAVLFHYTSALGLLFYFIPKHKSYKFIGISFLLMFISILCFDIILDTICSMVPYYSGYYMKYYGGDVKLAIIVSIIIHSLILLSCWYISLRNRFNDIIGMQFNMVCVSLLIMIMAIDFHMLDRCGFFFWSFVIVLIPNIINDIQNNTIKVLAIYCVYIVMLVRFITIIIYRPEWNHIYPYLFNGF